jgi:hypothetical protein
MANRITHCSVCTKPSPLLLEYEWMVDQARCSHWECVACHVRRTVREELKKAMVASPTGPRPIVLIED